MLVWVRDLEYIGATNREASRDFLFEKECGELILTILGPQAHILRKDQGSGSVR